MTDPEIYRKCAFEWLEEAAKNERDRGSLADYYRSKAALWFRWEARAKRRASDVG